MRSLVWTESRLEGCARRNRGGVERETGFEPATSTLARSHSTTELFPLSDGDGNRETRGSSNPEDRRGRVASAEGRTRWACIAGGRLLDIGDSSRGGAPIAVREGTKEPEEVANVFGDVCQLRVVAEGRGLNESCSSSTLRFWLAA